MFDEIAKEIKGEVEVDEATLQKYSHDASLFEVKPAGVVFPKDAQDVRALVNYVNNHKLEYPKLAITPRSAGTDMSGGALGESIIMDVSRHMQGTLEVGASEARVLPGTFYRDFEVETLKKNLILPCYTASKNLCAVGGMIANNAAGEKTLAHGKMEDYVKELKVVFSDGNEYPVRAITAPELDTKMKQRNYEGLVYRSVYNLIEKHKDTIAAGKPQVSKNSAGYYIWNVWDGQTFDLTKLLVGSQGTLGIVTEARLRLVPVEQASKLFVIFLHDLKKVSSIVNEVLPLRPESLESYDDNTLKLAVKFLPSMLKTMKTKHFLKLMLSFIPEVKMVLTRGMPKLVLLVEFVGRSEADIDPKMEELEKRLKKYKVTMHRTKSAEEAQKYWTIRRESFNLLRQHIKGKRTAPFIDDIVVKPEYMPEFLPRLTKILDEYKLVYTVAGHAGNGNFHIIPLMDMKDRTNVDKIMEVSEKVYNLVGEYHGSITGEHNDGIIRTPYLPKMFSAEMISVFQEIKDIFDPKGIFNPGKKVGGSIQYIRDHIVKS